MTSSLGSPPFAIRAGEIVRRAARRVAPHAAYNLAAALWDDFHGIRNMGWKPFFAFRSTFRDRSAPLSTLVPVVIRGLQYPVFVRPGTADAETVLHSCIRHAYAQYLPDGEVRLIVDAGANIGDTTVWYLNNFPQAMVIAIEPDADNFAVLSRNCAPYGARVLAKRAALWPDDHTVLRVEPADMASGISVSPSVDRSKTQHECASISPTTLMEVAGVNRIDILKCDIEGAELALFSDNYEGWLSRTRNIAIEIHSEACKRAVFQATSKLRFRHVRYRDLYVFEKTD